MALKGNSLFPQNNFNSDWQSTTPGWHSSSFKTIWCCINNKALQIHILPDCLWFWMALKKSPCFHRTISIQIDSPLPQDDAQAVSRQSDVVLNNKSSPNLIFHLLLDFDGSKKIPVSTEQFQFRLTVHYPMTLKQFQDNLMLIQIIKPPNSYSTSLTVDFEWL